MANYILFINSPLLTNIIDKLAIIRQIWRVVKISKDITDVAVLAELGGRLARIRLERNLSQAQLAEQAGVSKRTIERLEAGAVATQLSGFIRVCRVLEVLERFDALIPEPVPSPMALLKLRGRQRRRASGLRTAPPAAKKWQWGNEP
jgi:transcriptional regulator with XRE-family HTH domain